MSKKYCIVQFRDGKFGVRSQNIGWNRFFWGKNWAFLSKDNDWDTEETARHDPKFRYNTVAEAQAQLDERIKEDILFDKWWAENSYDIFVPDNGKIVDCKTIK